jgi:hypothetical protein
MSSAVGSAQTPFTSLFRSLKYARDRIGLSGRAVGSSRCAPFSSLSLPSPSRPHPLITSLTAQSTSSFTSSQPKSKPTTSAGAGAQAKKNAKRKEAEKAAKAEADAVQAAALAAHRRAGEAERMRGE